MFLGAAHEQVHDQQQAGQTSRTICGANEGLCFHCCGPVRLELAARDVGDQLFHALCMTSVKGAGYSPHAEHAAATSTSIQNSRRERSGMSFLT